MSRFFAILSFVSLFGLLFFTGESAAIVDSDEEPQNDMDAVADAVYDNSFETTTIDVTKTSKHPKLQTPEKDPATMPAKRPPPPQQRSKTSLVNVMSPRQVFGGELSQDQEDLVEASSMEMGDGRRLVRYTHRFGGLDVWDSATALVVDNYRMGGYIRTTTVSDKLRLFLTKKSAGRVTARTFLTPKDDKACVKQAKFKVKDATSKRFVYELPGWSNGSKVTLVDLFDIRGADTDSTGTPNQLFCFYDVLNKRILKTWKGIHHFYGDGGNVKIGKFRYGGDREKLPAVNGTSTKSCRMTTANGFVSVWDLKSQSTRIKTGGGQPITYDCNKGVSDSINGGYGPSADCFFYADKTVKMLMDPFWGGAQRIEEVTPVKTITVGVHYGSKYDNAFWDGNGLHMGDGDKTFFSSCSCYDVMAHEIGHAVTAATSRLIYSGDAGCINEAFSDMTGEAFKAYLNVPNDFKIATSCLKMKPFLRNFAELSVTMSTYKPPMEPHHCSPIFNHVFYKLATSPDWSVRTAYRAFIFANRMYWTAETNMTTAACDVISVVQQLKIGDPAAVIAAFGAVKVNVSHCLVRGDAIVSDSIIELKNCETASSLTAATGAELHYKIKVPEKATKQYVMIQGKTGDADLYVTIGGKPSETRWQWRPYWEGSSEYVNEPVAEGTAGTYYNIMIRATAGFSDVDLYACYY